MTSPLLRLEGITFSYGRGAVLQGVNLSVGEGEFIGIIGPNGSGKTTLLKVMARILVPASGVVRLGGQPIADMGRRELSQKVAFVPQEETTPFSFTAMEMVLMGRSPYLRGLQMEGAEDIAAAESAMTLTDCWRFRERDIHTLSGGERRRVYLARALAQEPDIILMDEPTTHLDIHHQVEIMERVEELNRGGLTVVMVSHDINLAARFCATLVALREGDVIRHGRPEKVINGDLLEELYGCRLRVASMGGRPLITMEREERGNG
ncbi:MAG: ABC transporter ATP-binding protein [Thermodesulfobacteriota bacterium]